jgi:hypothetical protein
MISLLLTLAPFYVWRYNGAVKVVNFPANDNKIGANGECPHCAPIVSYFRPVATYVHHLPNGPQKLVSACQCESCKGFVLVVGNRQLHGHKRLRPKHDDHWHLECTLGTQPYWRGN